MVENATLLCECLTTIMTDEVFPSQVFFPMAGDGKMRETDVANVQTLLRIIQSIPSPKTEPFKQWLAKVGYERMKEMLILPKA